VDQIDDPNVETEPVLGEVYFKGSKGNDSQRLFPWAVIPNAIAKLLVAGSRVPNFCSALMRLNQEILDSYAKSDEGQPTLRERDLNLPTPLGGERGFSGVSVRTLFETIPVFVPLFTDGPRMVPERTVKLLLVENKKGSDPWSKVKAPARGGPIVAAGAVFGFLEYLRLNEDYADDFQLALSGLRVVDETWEDMGRPDALPLTSLPAFSAAIVSSSSSL